MDSPEKIVGYLRKAADGQSIGFSRAVMEHEAADTIERLQKERDEGWANALRVQTERDAALAEVERLKGLANARETRIKHLEGELRGVYSEMGAK